MLCAKNNMKLRIYSEMTDQIVAHAYADYPREACGLIGGRDYQAQIVVPMSNISITPTIRYQIEFEEINEFTKKVQKQDQQLIGVYHSHPTASAKPSPTDMRYAIAVSMVYIIVGLVRFREPDIRAWSITLNRFTEVELLIEPLDICREAAIKRPVV